MRKIKDVGTVVNKLKGFLFDYLEDNDLIMGSAQDNFICPDHENHEKGTDNKPSCGFIPDTDNQKFHCFSCGAVGDIFKAYSIIEQKEITGVAFFEAVQALADQYKVPYELTEPSEEEKEFERVQKFLSGLIANAHKYLKENSPKECADYLKKRNWQEVLELFQLGYLPDEDRVRDYFKNAYSKFPELKSYIKLHPDKICNRLIIPVFGKNNSVLGLITRAVTETDARPKYDKTFLQSLKGRGIVFNLENVKGCEKIYLFEGQSSVMSFVSKGFADVAAIVGAQTFTTQVYNKLVRANIDKIVLCYDGDRAGEKCLDATIRVIQDKSDIKFYVKRLPEGMDPDDYIQEHGLDKFMGLEEMSVFKFQLQRLKENEEDVELKRSLYSMIISCKDNILQERMITVFLKEMKIQKSTLNNELQNFEKLKIVDSDIKVSDILEEKESFAKELERFEERVWRADKILGVSAGFNKFDEKMDGIQDGLHEIAGIWNVGKSAFMITMALNMLANPDNHILYFSIDDPVQTKTIPRLLANMSNLPINTVANPFHRIQNNETLDDTRRDEMLLEREKALDRLRDMSNRLFIKDSSHGYDLDYIERMIKMHKSIADERKLIVFVDFLHMVTCKNLEETALISKVCGSFKKWSALYNIPIITTVESTKQVGQKKDIYDGDIKGSVTLQYDADSIFLLWTNFNSGCGADKQLFYHREDGKGTAPIIRVKVSKNKISGFKGSLFFRFYPEYSLFQECDEAEERDMRERLGLGGGD